MSNHFIAVLSNAEWAAYKASRELERRDQWIVKARDFKERKCAEALRVAIHAARTCNREYLTAVAEYRASQTPKRKRA